MADSATYYSAAQTAKLVRQALKTAFPTVKFSVRSSTYAGGANVSVCWTDGPTAQRVDAITSDFNGRSFDGSIDMAYSIDAWVLDGQVIGTRTGGTAGSRGNVPARGMRQPHDDAELVHFGCSVSTSRQISVGFARRCADQVSTYYGLTRCPIIVADTFGHRLLDDALPTVGHYYMSDLIRQAASDATTHRAR